MALTTGGRLWRVLFIFYFLEAGAFLTLAPWSRFWMIRVVNRSPSGFREYLVSPYLRSFLVGLGLLHIVVAVLEIEAWRSEAARRREEAAAAGTPAAQIPP